jgi:hypothetical protein
VRVRLSGVGNLICAVVFHLDRCYLGKRRHGMRWGQLRGKIAAAPSLSSSFSVVLINEWNKMFNRSALLEPESL